MPRQRQHAGVLAGAVVVNGGAGLAVPDQCEARLLVEGPVRAACIEVFRTTTLREHRARHANVTGLAIVRGAAERDLLRREAETVCGAALYEGQALEGLDGGTRMMAAAMPPSAATTWPAAFTRQRRRGGGFRRCLRGDLGDDGIGHERSLCGDAARYQMRARSCASRNRPSAQL